MRIVGFDLPDNKKVEIAVTYIYGIGRANAVSLLKVAEVERGKRVKDLSKEEVGRIQNALGKFKIGGDLRAELIANIKRYKLISSYRGLRHAKNLPVRGQRTRTNARTKRGRKVTIGAIRKKVAERMGLIGGAVGKDDKK